jgi:hypothetical protein
LEAERRANAELEQLRREHDEKVAKENEEMNRLARFSGTISGGAWVIKKVGQSDILRGLNVYVIRARCSRRELDEPLKELVFHAQFDEGFTRSGIRSVDGVTEEMAVKETNNARMRARECEQLASLLPDDLIDSRLILSLIRSSHLGPSYYAMTHDDIWPKFLAILKTQNAITNIDGKYKFDHVQGGKYYIYSQFTTEFSVAEWLVPLTVDRSGEFMQDLFNETALLILNKKD